MQVVVSSSEYLLTFPGTIQSFTVKKNHIGSVIREIISYTHIDIMLISYNDNKST